MKSISQYFFGGICIVSTIEGRKVRRHDVEEGTAILLVFENRSVGMFVLTFIISYSAPTYGISKQVPEKTQCFHKPQKVPISSIVSGTKACLSVPDLTRWSYDDVVEKEGGEKGWNHELKAEKLGVRREDVAFDLLVEYFVNVAEGRVAELCR
ncbi:hypothetical protein BJ875DRAFT_126106 [Amylocarpus encephaloides]|uniref:Uncharacterized protein n=1 Tax=Amylocarpus encephaloides TaxID=45428 RepID=A0A9P7YQX9_9HELO|nr:hypothetical protein BJ875DRAFT_126106 [Amylocarpus encephaloides]